MGKVSAEDIYRGVIEKLLKFKPDVEADLDHLIKDEPRFAHAYLAKAYLGLLTSESGPSESAVKVLSQLEQHVPQSRLAPDEVLHRNVISFWAKGCFREACNTMDVLLVEYPNDVLGLFCGHQLDFFLGDKGRLRDRIARSLPEWEEDDYVKGFLRGMLAFGLEENCWYDRAEQEGLHALDMHPDDVWALHAVVHVYEMCGQAERGLQFMEERAQYWEEGNFFNVHNFWHKALYLLDLGDLKQVLHIYDNRLHNQYSQGVALEMLDAASLLWRLLLMGRIETERFNQLADAWWAWLGEGSEDHPGYGRGAGKTIYVFNDCHAVMALVGAGRLDDARRVIHRIEDDLNSQTNVKVSNQEMIQLAGLPVARALLAFGEEDYQKVVEELLPVRYDIVRFGGSDAQRDAIERTLLEAAIRSRQWPIAKALANQRWILKASNYDNLIMRRLAGDRYTFGT